MELKTCYSFSKYRNPDHQFRIFRESDLKNENVAAPSLKHLIDLKVTSIGVHQSEKRPSRVGTEIFYSLKQSP